MDDHSLEPLASRYYRRQEALHGECFYHDFYDTREIERLVHDTAEYVSDAERLARG